MARRRAGSGVGGLALLVAVLYFTGAGSWLWARVKTLDSACYSALSGMGGGVATPVCGVLAKGIHAVDSLGDNIHEQFAALRDQLLGSATHSLPNLSSYSTAIRDKLSGLTSSGDALASMMRAGPQAMGKGGNLAQQFQQAVDSFAIGQKMLSGGTGAPGNALPWFQQGAAQPQGFGLMSQLTLGNLYASGGQGVAANPQLALGYLTQAQQSLAVLNGSNTPQSQQLLQALPVSPQLLQQQLVAVIHQIRGK